MYHNGAKLKIYKKRSRLKHRRGCVLIDHVIEAGDLGALRIVAKLVILRLFQKFLYDNCTIIINFRINKNLSGAV